MKSGKMISIGSDDTIKAVDYNGYESLRTCVEGYIEHFFDMDFEADGKDFTVTFYCNEEGLLRNDTEALNNVNAVIKAVLNEEPDGAERYGTTIPYGNVAVVGIDYESGDSFGLTDKQAEVVLKTLGEIKEKNVDFISEFHDRWNYEKPNINMTINFDR